MNELNLDNLNKLAMASSLIENTMKTGVNNEIDILKKYVKENLIKCNNNYRKIVQFIDEHKDMFYKITNLVWFEVEPLNGLKNNSCGYKRFITNGKVIIQLERDDNSEILTHIELDSSIRDGYYNPNFMELWRRDYHWEFSNLINFNEGDINVWLTNKKKIDNYITYTDRMVKEFENMVKDIVDTQLIKMKEVEKESNDALSNIAKVKEIVITYGV